MGVLFYNVGSRFNEVAWDQNLPTTAKQSVDIAIGIGLIILGFYWAKPVLITTHSAKLFS